MEKISLIERPGHTNRIIPNRRVLHIDLDAFFASAELLRYPQLKNLPLVIGGKHEQPLLSEYATDKVPLDKVARLKDYYGRGVVTTCTYEARVFGIRSGMSLKQATLKHSDCLLLPVDIAYYKKLSQKAAAIIACFVQEIEKCSIDEFCIELEEGIPLEHVQTYATKIQETIEQKLGLTCSIGIGPNKLLAKIGSEQNKPRGIYIWHYENHLEKYWSLTFKDIPGIGPKTVEKFNQIKPPIRTLQELARYDKDALQRHFGNKYACWLHDTAWAIDNRLLDYSEERLSISRETTFDNDLDPITDNKKLGAALDELCYRLSEDLQKEQVYAKTIGIKLRFSDFQQITREHTFNVAVQSATALRKYAGHILARAPWQGKKIRLMGVRGSNWEVA